MDKAQREELIARYKAGAEEVRKAVAEVGDRLDVRSDPKEWTAREIAHHLADSEITSAVRLRRLLAEDRPEIAGYDENLFAQRLHYDRPIEASLDAMEAARRSSADLLDVLTEDEWARAGTHSESGPYGVTTWLMMYADHPYDHSEQMRRAAGLAP
jgi:DinB superfamily